MEGKLQQAASGMSEEVGADLLRHGPLPGE